MVKKEKTQLKDFILNIRRDARRQRRRRSLYKDANETSLMEPFRTVVKVFASVAAVKRTSYL